MIEHINTIPESQLRTLSAIVTIITLPILGGCNTITPNSIGAEIDTDEKLNATGYTFGASWDIK